MIAEEVDELVDFDLDEVPVCGTNLSGWKKRSLRITDCPKEATWQLTTRCCGTRSTSKCDEHKRKCELSGVVCHKCERYPLEQTWRKL